jgi:hypothetical protein
MPQARAVLQRVLQGRITFTPAGTGYTFEAATRFDRLFTGIASPRPTFVPWAEQPAHIGPEDTFDGDYGRLLERAANRGKGVASPEGMDASKCVPMPMAGTADVGAA